MTRKAQLAAKKKAVAYLKFVEQAQRDTLEEMGQIRSVLYSDLLYATSENESRYKAWKARYTGLIDRAYAIAAQVRLATEAVKTASLALKTPINPKQPVTARPSELRKDLEPDPPALPLPVTEVDSLPKYVDHSLDETLQRRADVLVSWNYHSLGMGHRRSASRRYEGFSR